MQQGGPTEEAILDRLSSFALFADLSTAELRALAHRFEEAYFSPGERVLRRGISGSAFYVIVEGRASVRVDGAELNRLTPGDYFGEVSILLEETPSADVVAETELRCVVLAGPDVHEMLMRNPKLMYRMLQAEARKVRNTTRWRS